MKEIAFKDLRLIGQGGYGCAYLDISGDIVEKLQQETDLGNREFEIGKRIQQIPDFQERFSPVLQESKAIRIAHLLSQPEIKKCKIVKKIYDENAKKNKSIVFRSYKMRYVGKTEMYSFLKRRIQSSKFTRTCLTVHSYLLESFKLLVQERIVHFDIKENNIIMDKDTKVPVIIDFGLAYHMPRPDDASLLKIFSIYSENYSPWPIDYIFLCFIRKIYGSTIIQTDTVVDTAVFFEVLTTIFEKNKVYTTIKNSDTVKQSWKTYISSFENKPIKDFVFDLYSHWKTWDHYSCAVIFLFFVDIQYDETTILYLELLNSIVYSIPAKRPSLQKSLQIMRELLH